MPGKSIDVLFLGGTSIDLIQNGRYAGKFSASVGGSVTNSAIISAKLGLKTAMLSRIGKDPLSDFALQTLRSCQVNISGIIQDPDIRTPLAIANIDRTGNSTYTFYKNPARSSIVPLKTVPKSLLNTCKFLHFGSSFSYQKETFIETLKYIRHLKKRGVFMSYDPNLRPYALKDKKGTRKRVLRLLKQVDLAKLSLLDLKFLTGQENPEKGLKKLKTQLKCEIILTLGIKGAMHMSLRTRSDACPVPERSEWYGEATEDEMSEGVPSPQGEANLNLIKVPAFKVKVADTIGAGDAFTAGILYKIARIGKKQVFSDIKPHLTFASAISAIICTRPGANKALKGPGQVRSFLAKHAD
ncbi:MAG: carbohydrate kinase [Candidatus Omnitrophica bacterium]|nr:carbohydrate kinase [Candidatus Omnitrophota bacterium]